jgi:hypothetical protein
MTKKDIEKLHDDLYDQAAKVIEKYKPCNFQKIGKYFVCEAKRKKMEEMGEEWTKNNINNMEKRSCCNSFCKQEKHWTEKEGCKTKNVLCKAYVCKYITDNNKIPEEDLKELDRVAKTAMSLTGSNCFEFYMPKSSIIWFLSLKFKEKERYAEHMKEGQRRIEGIIASSKKKDDF